MNESNDCSVKALAIGLNVDYMIAHEALRLQGRKNREGAMSFDILVAARKLGFDLHHVDPQEFIAKYPGGHKNLKNVTTHHMDRFNKVWADGERYLVLTPRHVLAVVDGVNHDWTKGKAHRVVSIYRIHNRSEAILNKMLAAFSAS